jgi:3-isopropylmalate/(R)-2-methylmalate dehydratase small subunit
MNIKGKVWKFGDDIDTDQIIPTQYLTLPTIEDMAVYTMEPQDPEFSKKYTKGDIIVGGKNFGCGSSREQAPAVLKSLGVTVIIAESFARIFFRNCINLGILLIEIKDTSKINTGDEITIDAENNVISCNNDKYNIIPLSDFLKKIIEKGGLVNYLKK